MKRKLIQVMVIVAKIFSVIVMSIGALSLTLAIGLTIYEISIHVHHGFLEMSDNNRAFLLFSLTSTGLLFLSGTLGFFKANSALERLKSQKCFHNS